MSIAVDPVAGDPNKDKRFVFFGTGSYFKTGDPADAQVNTWYALIDEGSVISGRSALKQRTVSTTTTFDGKSVRSFSSATAGDMTGKKGWYVDLSTSTYERIVTKSVYANFVSPTLIASSIIPNATDQCASGGKGFVNFINKGKQVLHPNVFHAIGDRQSDQGTNIGVEVAMQWNSGYNEQVLCFTNNIPQRDGGTHLTGLRAAMTRVIGKYIEANELAKVITQLQPRFPRVWVFHAWNMSYNISVATQTPQERWDWVNAGIKLLRDEGIPANPNDLLLHKELAWIFMHKIGGITDDANQYKVIGPEFQSHEVVNHTAKEYARGDVTTNTVESSFALLKRGLIGTFHHVGEQHLQRYCNEFDFRWNTRQSLGFSDVGRSNIALKQIANKRLTYRRTDAEQALVERRINTGFQSPSA